MAIDRCSRAARNLSRVDKVIAQPSGRAFAFLALTNFLFSVVTWGIEPPRVLDPDWTIEAIATEPNLVTPVGCCFDDSGRLLVVECHTHFPPEDYKGPKTDRIYRFDDSDGDGVVDRQRLFYEGGKATMGIAKLTDGWFAVATRSEVVRIRDRDDDGTAEQREVLLTLDTVAEYPHNGLAGLAVGPDGRLYVGQGENFGEPYELVAADGSKQVGGGEGGNIFSCTLDGKDLNRIATGFWNPFGMYFDSANRLWVVGNDPDAMPPCRLLNVIPGGDYGFQFRFGRAGTHPLLSWDGEFPGTLPMVAGTGEAPCAVLGYGDALWVSSWGDNRVERYKLAPEGASWSSETDVVIQGDANFRPVGMAVAPDGSMYITDWVDRSYPVHGKGRLWRVSRKADAAPVVANLPEESQLEKQARRLTEDAGVIADERFEALGNQDPWIRQSAATGLVHFKQLQLIDRDRKSSPEQRVGLLSAWRWSELANSASLTSDTRRDWIDWGLNDQSEEIHSEDVLLAAIRWATERGAKEHLGKIRSLVERPNVSPRLFAAVMASIAYLETGSAARGTRDPAIESLLLKMVADQSRPASVRAMAVRMLPSESNKPSDAELRHWISQSQDRPLGTEMVRLLSARATESARKELAAIAIDESVALQTRADAIAALARNAGEYSAALNQLALPRQPEVIRQEAGRVLKRTWNNESKPRPHRDDLDAWDQIVGSGGDIEAGRRVFFRTTCVNCHSHSGRGAKTGPDLTTLSGTMTSKRVLESILNPSKEVGPLYVPWRVLTVNGQVLTGLKLDKSGVGNSLRFQGADGMTFEVPLADIETQDPIAQSIMPTGLEDAMSLDEMRDLIAFLVRGNAGLRDAR